MISFIVPAHNEQACLALTLQAIHESAAHVGDQGYEIIVVNDASTDATVQVAIKHQAKVLTVNHRHIAATRNSGAGAAGGKLLFFVDADTIVNPRAINGALLAMNKGAAGGGALTRLDDNVPLYGRLMSALIGVVARVMGFTGGGFHFCSP